MSTERFRIGFLPLVDAALPILAHELGFAEAEGVAIELVRDVTWATVRDRLLYGHTDAAHMVAPLAIASALGRDRPPTAMTVPFVLGLNGNAITFSTALGKACGLGETLGDPFAVGAALRAVLQTRRLRFGVVHRHSSHNYMLRYWLAGVGIRPDVDIELVVTSPPFAAAALATAQIWRRGVEKVLAMRADVADERREVTQQLIRALHAAAAHFVQPETAEASAAILARPTYLDAPADAILRAITDRIRLVQGGEPVHYPDFMFQFREAANFPWRSQAAWLYAQMTRWEGRGYDPGDAAIAAATFRPDLYRAALAGSVAVLPGASSKLEGALGEPIGAGSTQGRLMLGNDRFFDGRAFDPDDIPGYLAALP